MFFDVGKEYRQKVTAFNTSSLYGCEQAKIIQREIERIDTKSQGGLNRKADEYSPETLESRNPHSSVLGDQAVLRGIPLWTTKYEEKELNKVQYIQPPKFGYVRNHKVDFLEEIEANRVSTIRTDSFNGNGNMGLKVDKMY